MKEKRENNKNTSISAEHNSVMVANKHCSSATKTVTYQLLGQMQTVASGAMPKCAFWFWCRKDYPVVPRSTVRQRSCSTGILSSGESQALRGSPETAGSPYSCENSLNSTSPQELLGAPPTHYTLPHPHLQPGQQPQAYNCSKRKGGNMTFVQDFFNFI